MDPTWIPLEQETATADAMASEALKRSEMERRVAEMELVGLSGIEWD